MNEAYCNKPNFVVCKHIATTRLGVVISTKGIVTFWTGVVISSKNIATTWTGVVISSKDIAMTPLGVVISSKDIAMTRPGVVISYNAIAMGDKSLLHFTRILQHHMSYCHDWILLQYILLQPKYSISLVLDCIEPTLLQKQL